MLINRMRFCIVLFYLVCMIALSTAGKKDENVHEEEYKGGHKPYERDLSDKEHHEDDEEMHNPAFDHEAFLGKEESEKFDHLDPEESKQRLGKLIDEKVDLDKDGKVTPSELKEWLSKVSRQSMAKAMLSRFMNMKAEAEAKDMKAPFTWDEYYRWKFLTEGKTPPKAGEKKDMDEHFKETLAREQRKWKVADTDGDGALSLEEFTAFIHPEEAPHMRDIVIEEALAHSDRDKDGFISEAEFMKDQYPEYVNDTASKKKLPEWVEKERKDFQTKYDKNKDGKLSPQEIYRWIVPEDVDKAVKEAKHLIEKADTDKDGVLTKEEILNNHDLFAGSQATDFGAALNRHEEL